MAGLINYDLQQSPESAMKTGDIIDRYEWAPGIQQLGRTAEGALDAYKTYQKRLKEDAAKQQKIQENIDESNYEREIRQLSVDLETIPNMTSSERIRRIQEVDDMYSHIDPAKRSAIRKTTGLGDEYNISYNLSTQRGQEYVAQKKEEDAAYMNLARAFKGSAVDTMSPEEQIQLGKQIENENVLNNSNTQYITSGNVNESLVPSVNTTSAISLQSAVSSDAENQIASGGSLDYEWVNNEAAVMLNRLQAAGYSPDQAAALTQRSMYYYKKNAEYLSKNQDEAAKVKANNKKMMTDQYAINLQELTGMPLEVNLSLLNNLQYISDSNVRGKVLGTMDQLYAAGLNNYVKNSYLTPSDLYTQSVLNTIASPGTSIQAPASALQYALGHEGEFTRGQITNQGLVLNQALSTNLLSSDQKLLYSQEDLDAYLNSSADNAKEWARLTQESLPSVTDQFVKATPEEQKVIKDSYNKVMYNFLEDALEKVARDTRGAITYSDGVLSSNYTLDRDLIRDTNAILNEMKNVSWNAKGAVDSWKEVDNRIKQMVADKSLGLENKSSVSSDLAAMMNPVAAALGSVAGTEQGLAFGMTPREAARTSANMRRMGIGTEGFRKFVENTLSSAAAVSPTQYISEIPQGIQKVSDRTKEVGGQIFGMGVQKVEDELNKRSGNFLDFIKGFESFRGETYDDVGQPAIGYGFRKSTLQNAPEETKKKLEQVVPGITSEGFNRITKEQASAVLPILLEDIYVPEAKKFVGENWDNLPEPVKEVVIDMDFNMGYERTKPDGTKGGLITFKNFREALQKGDLKKAAQEIENSSYFKNKGSHERAIANIDKILRSL